MAICKDCSKRASYGLSTDEKPSYCSSHKLDGMVDLVHKKCVFDGCETRPCYAFKGDKKASYCVTHKLDDMIDIISKRCVLEGCEKQPCYGYKKDKQASYCVTHKLDDMIDLKHKRCVLEGCETRPCYGFKGDKKASYCVTHKLDDMIDIISKRCNSEGCETHPCYGFRRDKQASYCVTHKLEGMIDLVHKKCVFDGCETRPCYGFKGDKKASYCVTHKLDDMSNIVDKLCLYCNYTVGWFNGYCVPCFYQQNPEHVKSKQHKTRENAFMQPLKELYPTIVLDKTVECGCSKKRPDGLIDLYTHSIIVEIDENQHQGYSCENMRTMQLFQDLGNRPLVMIRLNPDSYTVDGKRHMGAFSTSKVLGTLQIKKNEFNLRYSKLLETIKMCHEIPDKEITVIELFMNQ